MARSTSGGLRHPRLARAVNRVGTEEADAAAEILYATGEVVTAGVAVFLGVVLVVGVVWPRFNVTYFGVNAEACVAGGRE